jgi:hypothetical protein
MDAPAPTKPTRRWHQRRLLRYVAVLVVACVGAYFAWDALFMPDDLRRLQGTWKAVRRFDAGKEEIAPSNYWIVIDGRRLTDRGSSDNDAALRLDIIPDRREFRVYEESMIHILGNPVRLPIRLGRGNVAIIRYEWIGSTLKLRRLLHGHDDMVWEFNRDSPQ